MILGEVQNIHRAHQQELAQLARRCQDLEDENEVLRARIEGHKTAEIALASAKDQLERQVNYLADGLRQSTEELSEIRKGLMIRVGLLPAPRQQQTGESHKPIELRRQPWDQTRATLEQASREKLEHWQSKIKEVEERDRARVQESAPQVPADVDASDIAELERE